MPKGKPAEGRRAINPDNKPGPAPKPDEQKKKRRDFWLTEAEFEKVKEFAQSLRD